MNERSKEKDQLRELRKKKMQTLKEEEKKTGRRLEK